jgi:hypothetical protein
MSKVIVVTPPSEFWKHEPESHIIEHDELLGWSVRQVGADFAQVISEEEAREALASWRCAYEHGWEVAQTHFAPDKNWRSRLTSQANT